MHVVVSCGLCVAPTHHHVVHTRRALIFVFQQIAVEYKIALGGWRKAPAVGHPWGQYESSHCE